MPRHRFVTRFGSFRLLAVMVLVALFAGLLSAVPLVSTPARAASAATGTGGLFVSQTARIWDTAAGRDGAPTAGTTAGTWYSVGVAGLEGLPATGISAVQVNFEVAGFANGGVLHADKDGTATPNSTVSYVNYTTTSASNGATIAVGSDGKIQVQTTSGANVRIDVQGYFTSGNTSAGGYVPVKATTLKTLPGVASNTYSDINVGGVSPVPSTASGVMLNIQESNSHATGYLIAYAKGATRPGTALYWPGTQNDDFSSAVPLGTNGQVTVYVGTGGAVDLSVSVEGYFTATTNTPAAGSFTPASARVFDSRSPSAPIAASGTSTVQVTGKSGVPSAGSGIQAVVVNIGIVAGSGATGHLQAYADDQSPGTATQQFYASSTTSIFAVIPLGADGGIKIQNSSGGTINVVVDVEGWYSGISGAVPSGQTSTQKSLTLQGTEGSGGSWVTYKYSVGTTGSFVPVPPADVSPTPSTTSGSGASAAFQSQATSTNPPTFSPYTWNIAQTLANADAAASPVTNYATAGALLQVEACFGTSATDTAPVCSMPSSVTYDPSAFGDAKDTTTVGPGSLSLLTGDFEVSSTDADAASSLDSLSVGRTLTTLTPPAATASSTGVFGPGWTADLSGPDAGNGTLKVAATAAGVDNAAKGYELFTDTDGAPNTYQATSALGTYPISFTGVGDNAGDGELVSKVNATTITMTDPDGTVTTWTKTGSVWAATAITEPGSATTSTYVTSAAGATSGLVTRILGPVPAGVSCTNADTTPGCRSLLLNYQTTTVGGSSVERLSSISSSLPQTAGTSNIAAIAAYDYTSGGLLADAYDPRISPALKTAYTYNSAGRLSTLTPPGQAAFTLGYDSTGKVSTVSRPDPAGTTAKTTIVYNLPVTGTTGLPSMAATDTATWDETTDLPVTATAVFDPDHVPAGTTAATVTSSDWPFASVDYLDVNGRPVNTAAYGAGAWQIATTQYDSNGDDTSELTAGNRAQALTPTASTDPYVAGRGSSAERADFLASWTVYNPLNLSQVTDTYGPTHPITLSTGSTIDGRDHTGTVYDQGAPTDGSFYGLPTTLLNDSYDVQAQTDPGGADLKITTLGYGPLLSGDTSGWTLRAATTSTVQMGGSPSSSDLTSFTRYNASGQTIETGLPGGYNAAVSSGVGTAQDTDTTYYTATGTGSCVNAANAGLTCSTGPDVQPTTGNPLPVTTYTYDADGNTLTKVETAGYTVRTTTNTYDAGEREVTSGITVTPSAAGGIPLPVVTTAYSSTNGAATSTSTGSGVTALSDSVVYNNVGEATSYTDSTGNVSTTSYDVDRRPTAVNDGKGTTNYTYDSTNEHRGLVTSENLNLTGMPSTFTATYDASGAMTMETYPNGITSTWGYDNTGAATSLVTGMNGTTWANYTETRGIGGQIVADSTPSSSQKYAFDPDDRLTQVQDTVSQGQSTSCTTRNYGFDADSNRITLTSYASDNAGNCTTSTAPATTTSSYDQADRIINTGYQYDTLGRTTLVPAVDAAGIGQYATSTGNLSIGYYANDMVSTETQGTGSISYTLDPEQNRIGSINNGSTVTTNHYSDGSDSPAWSSTNSSTFNRSLYGIDGSFAVSVDQTGGATLELTDMRGDVVATALDSTGDTTIQDGSYNESTEFGIQRSPATGPLPYGWLGTDKRSFDSLGGVSLMGVRLYNPSTGRFLSKDPLLGGNADAYVYPTDPVDARDTSGREEEAIPGEGGSSGYFSGGGLSGGGEETGGEGGGRTEAGKAPTSGEAEAQAKKMNFKEYKQGGKIHGAKVFKKKNVFISADTAGHGGYWKKWPSQAAFNKKQTPQIWNKDLSSQVREK